MTQTRLRDINEIDPRSFLRYTRSINADLKKTFAGIRREQWQQTLEQGEGGNSGRIADKTAQTRCRVVRW
jgi:hypothetical protein